MSNKNHSFSRIQSVGKVYVYAYFWFCYTEIKIEQFEQVVGISKQVN